MLSCCVHIDSIRFLSTGMQAPAASFEQISWHHPVAYLCRKHCRWDFNQKRGRGRRAQQSQVAPQRQQPLRRESRRRHLHQQSEPARVRRTRTPRLRACRVCILARICCPAERSCLDSVEGVPAVAPVGAVVAVADAHHQVRNVSFDSQRQFATPNRIR